MQGRMQGHTMADNIKYSPLQAGAESGLSSNLVLKITAGTLLFSLISNVLFIAYLTRPESGGSAAGLTTQSGEVAFSVSRAATTAPAKVKFKRKSLNAGQGFNMATGEFTAPKSGIYSFSWSGVVYPDTDVRMLLMKNGQEVASTWASSTKYDSFAGTQVHFTFWRLWYSYH